MRPSTHLTWTELACKDGSAYPLEWRDTRGRELGRMFEAIRAIYRRPITVGSAYRTVEHNRLIGGARNSQHVQGRALDLYPPRGVSVTVFAAAIRDLADAMVSEGDDLIGGIGYYPTFVHVDTRGVIGDRLIVWWGHRPQAERSI